MFCFEIFTQLIDVVQHNQAHPKWFQKILIYVSRYSGYDRMKIHGKLHLFSPKLTKNDSFRDSLERFVSDPHSCKTLWAYSILLSVEGMHNLHWKLQCENFMNYPSYNSLSTKKHRSMFFEITLYELDFAGPRQLVE